MKLNHLIYILLFMVAFPAAIQAQSSIIQESILCEAVEDRQPQRPKDTFVVGEKVYCWMRLLDAEVGSKITLKWYAGQDEVDSYDLDIKYASMRTYGNKTLFRSGIWRVDILDASGQVLDSSTFTVTEAE